MRRRRFGLLAAVLLCALPAATLAFTLLRVGGNPCGTQPNLFWGGARASVSVDALPEPEANLVLQGLTSWSDAAGRFRFRSTSGPHCDNDDGIIGVGIGTTGCDGRSLDGVIAYTTSIFRVDSGELVDASITFNANAPPLDDQAIFLQAALHELGHGLGLDHSDACGASGAGTLMKATIILNDPRLSAPQQDDINGANRIYGGGGDPTPLPEGTNSCAAGGGGSVGIPLLFAFVLIGLRRACTSVR